MLPLCSDSWELMASNGFLHLHVFALVCVVVAVCYIAVPLVFFSAFFLFFSGAGVCNPILKRVKSICEENEVCKKKNSKKTQKSVRRIGCGRQNAKITAKDVRSSGATQKSKAVQTTCVKRDEHGIHLQPTR